MDTKCIEWTGKKLNGYGWLMVGEPGNRHWKYAHRWAWEHAHGPIPDGRVIMHLCDNPACVNVAHLRPGTVGDNQLDMASKGRGHNQKKSACPNGHPYDTTITLLSGPKAGQVRRRCSVCINERRRERYRALVAAGVPPTTAARQT